MASRLESAEDRRLRLIAAAEEFATRGNVAVAIREYSELLDATADDEVVLRRLGDLHARAGGKEKATDILLRLATVYERAGSLTKAVAVHKRINKLDRSRVETYEELARLYEKLKLFYEASEQWRALAAYAVKSNDRKLATEYGKKAQELRAKRRTPPERRAEDNPVADLAVDGIPVVSAPVDMVVFLGHASEDKPAVRELYHRLQEDHFQPWLDEEDLIAGQNWRKEIPKAVRRSHAFVVCLSGRSTTKSGYLQKEIKFALDVLDEQPEGIIFVIPVRLEPCDVPEALQHLHYVDMYDARGYERLRRALNARAKQLGLGKGDAA